MNKNLQSFFLFCDCYLFGKAQRATMGAACMQYERVVRGVGNLVTTVAEPVKRANSLNAAQE